jgi:hypothetical protein
VCPATHEKQTDNSFPGGARARSLSSSSRRQVAVPPLLLPHPSVRRVKHDIPPIALRLQSTCRTAEGHDGLATGKLDREGYLLNMIGSLEPRQAERHPMQMRVLGCAAGAILSLTACNTVTRGTEETVTISASPASSRIWTSLGHECPRSPCVVKVSRKTEFTAYAEARGYQPGSLLVKSVLTDQAAPGVLGNAILPGGSVGLVLDAANGAMLDHRPNPAHIDLVPAARSRRR